MLCQGILQSEPLLSRKLERRILLQEIGWEGYEREVGRAVAKTKTNQSDWTRTEEWWEYRNLKILTFGDSSEDL
jgi:hypothetical protein